MPFPPESSFDNRDADNELDSNKRKNTGNQRLRKGIKRFLSFALTALPIKRDKIVMDNFNGGGYGDNPSYIAEELRKKHRYKIIWLTNSTDYTFPEGVTPVEMYSLRSFYESATAKAWVFNTRHRRLTKKRKGQVYLQTWHGSIGPKKIEQDAEETLSKNYIMQAKEDGQIADGILVDGLFNDKLFQRSFWLGDQCELLRFGTPRSDHLLNEKDNKQMKEDVRKKLGAACDSFCVLYAPTFRDDYSTNGYIIRFDKLRKAFEQKFGKTEIIVRLHPNAVEEMESQDFFKEDSLINATDYPNADDLVIAADCLITDFSSIAYDFAIIDKPVFLCITDLEEYRKTRGLYEFFYEQPFRLNTSEEMLIEDILTRDSAGYLAGLKTFYEKYPTYNDGSATKKAVEWLINKGLKDYR